MCSTTQAVRLKNSSISSIIHNSSTWLHFFNHVVALHRLWWSIFDCNIFAPEMPRFGFHHHLSQQKVLLQTPFVTSLLKNWFLFKQENEIAVCDSTTFYSGHHLIEFLMEKWRLKCTKQLDGFSFLPPHKASKLSGDIQLAEIVLDEMSLRWPTISAIVIRTSASCAHWLWRAVEDQTTSDYEYLAQSPKGGGNSASDPLLHRCI